MRLWDHLVAAARRAGLVAGGGGAGARAGEHGLTAHPSVGFLGATMDAATPAVAAPSEQRWGAGGGALQPAGSEGGSGWVSLPPGAAPPSSASAASSALVSFRDLMSVSEQQRRQQQKGVASAAAADAGSGFGSGSRRILRALVLGEGWFDSSACGSPDSRPLALSEGRSDRSASLLGRSSSLSRWAIHGSGRRGARQPETAAATVAVDAASAVSEGGVGFGAAALLVAEDSALLKAVLDLRVGARHGGGEEEGADGHRGGACVGLSLGQQQLLCMARMLLQRRQIVLLDECTASVDHASSAIMRQVWRQWKGRCQGMRKRCVGMRKRPMAVYCVPHASEKIETLFLAPPLNAVSNRLAAWSTPPPHIHIHTSWPPGPLLAGSGAAAAGSHGASDCA